ncbi:unnamed protein product [Moneuplotes crassus]|uniref:Uncharacterized protein n=1 Tax=Euplotes crassus TaxID=5936 RepID=A0AAD2D3J6_EUPCR|nr:unnamed protein product [Moneuplotes crassus]
MDPTPTNSHQTEDNFDDNNSASEIFESRIDQIRAHVIKKVEEYAEKIFTMNRLKAEIRQAELNLRLNEDLLSKMSANSKKRSESGTGIPFLDRNEQEYHKLDQSIGIEGLQDLFPQIDLQEEMEIS